MILWVWEKCGRIPGAEMGLSGIEVVDWKNCTTGELWVSVLLENSLRAWGTAPKRCSVISIYVIWPRGTCSQAHIW